LNRAAYKIGTLVGAGLVDGDTALAALTIAGIASGLSEVEVDRTVPRSIADGARHPRRVVLTDMDIGDAYVISMADTRGAVGELEPSTLYPGVDWRYAFEHAPDDINWLTYPVMESGRLYTLYSPAKAGKSLLTLDICAALAAGKPCLGNPAAPPVDVVYVDMENNIEDLVERLTDMGYGWRDLDRLHYHSFPPLPALDSRQGGVHLTALATQHQARLVVIDTVSRVIAGKESDSDTFHALYRYCMAPLKSMGITVLRLDHSGKDAERGMRGSSAKTTDVDVAWQLDRVGESRMRLNRKESRSNTSPESVLIEQVDSPLRHVILPSGVPDTRVTEVIGVLEKLDIPSEWGRDKVRTSLAGTGYKYGNALLSEAIRSRRIAFTG
jgi:RecA-family ATPase